MKNRMFHIAIILVSLVLCIPGANVLAKKGKDYDRHQDGSLYCIMANNMEVSHSNMKKYVANRRILAQYIYRQSGLNVLNMKTGNNVSSSISPSVNVSDVVGSYKSDGYEYTLQATIYIEESHPSRGAITVTVHVPGKKREAGSDQSDGKTPTTESTTSIGGGDTSTSTPGGDDESMTVPVNNTSEKTDDTKEETTAESTEDRGTDDSDNEKKNGIFQIGNDGSKGFYVGPFHFNSVGEASLTGSGFIFLLLLLLLSPSIYVLYLHKKELKEYLAIKAQMKEEQVFLSQYFPRGRRE